MGRGDRCGAAREWGAQEGAGHRKEQAHDRRLCAHETGSEARTATAGATAAFAGLHGTEVAAGTLAARMAFGALGQFGTAEDVEAVDGMEHHILVEHVGPRVGASQRGEGARDLALPVEEVEGLQAQGEGFVFEHRL